MRKRGFTLVELMVVIALMAILAAVILPEMRGTFDDATLRSTARKLVSALNLAHSRAVTLQQLHRVVFDPSAGQFTVERTARSDEGKGYVALTDVPGGSGQFAKQLKVDVRKNAEAEGTTIAFYPDGTADAAEIVLRDREGFQLGLRINAITARISIEEILVGRVSSRGVGRDAD